MKYDGVNIHKAGLINWQPGAFITADTTVPPISSSTPRSSATISISAATRGVKVALADSSTFTPGTQVKFAGFDDVYTISSLSATPVAAPTDWFYYLDVGPTMPTGTPVMSEVFTYRYYYRMDAVDTNNNVIRSAISQSQDYTVQLTANAGVRHKVIGLPEWGNLDYDRIYLQCYRTLSGTSGPFYRVHQERMNFNDYSGYIEFIDSVPDSTLVDTDPASLLKGGELGIGWDTLPLSKYVTAAGSTLVQANITGYPEVDMRLFGSSSLTNSQIAGSTVLLKRDITASGTVTNMVDRVTYEFRLPADSVAATAYSSTPGTSFTLDVVSPRSVGNWVYLYHSTVATANRPLSLCG